jgi:hypothetical protein
MKFNESELLLWFCTLLGVIFGGYLPGFWGAALFSPMSLLGGLMGGLLGFGIAYKVNQLT